MFLPSSVWVPSCASSIMTISQPVLKMASFLSNFPPAASAPRRSWIDAKYKYLHLSCFASRSTSAKFSPTVRDANLYSGLSQNSFLKSSYQPSFTTGLCVIIIVRFNPSSPTKDIAVKVLPKRIFAYHNIRLCPDLKRLIVFFTASFCSSRK